MLSDRAGLYKRLRSIEQRIHAGKPVDRALPELKQALEQSRQRAGQRRANLPVPVYPDDLPVCQRREMIKAAIAEHPVVIIAGETGSGKTTQLPKICLELGRGVTGMIGHTQPRRIAARSVALRIATELQSPLGHVVGYKVRFSDQTRPDAYIKVMTDGILLAEMQDDRRLEAYDTIIIDEAHERSLNIDFLLGYLKQLLPQRPDLKLIITSATIDTGRFSRHFDSAPVVEVSGRSYPVEVRYRPLPGEQEGEEGKDRVQGILDGVDELSRLDRHGHVLVFLPGEREIHAVAEALRKHHPPSTEILPLYARLSAAEQGRIFQPAQHQRIILATNVAETSLTVPGVRYVIDPGLARISRYSYRSKIQRLPVEPISRASADQRKGRCGRVAPGVCLRLYSEEDYRGRAEYTPAEIHRTNLASVILQMQSLGLGDIALFPFVEPPDSRLINDGYTLLHELGAVDEQRRLTPLGGQLARLPIDPRIGRMILAARDRNCLQEVLIIASALSSADPRERPLEFAQAADEKHRAFHDERSDFISLLKLWVWYQQHRQQLSRNKLRRLCHDHFISALRMQEWQDIHNQLVVVIKELGMRPNTEPGDYAQIHQALLSGLLGNIGTKQEKGEYLGARGKKFYLFPGSAVFRKAPKWVMAAEQVETTRLYARTVAGVEPEWIEQIAAPLCKRNYFEPHWEKKRAQVVADEQVTLYGLIIVPRRRVHYGSIDPVESHRLFIRHALVQGDYECRAGFFQHNRALIEAVEQLEHKSRRRDVLVDEEMLYQFYDERIPAQIHNGKGFERWLQQEERARPRLLYMNREDLMRHQAAGVSEQQFPDHLELHGAPYPLGYHFEPGRADDGVTLTIPVTVLNQMDEERCAWLVPGLIEEKIVYLIKALPKAIRRNFVPASDYARACLEAMPYARGGLEETLAAQLRRISGVEISTESWREMVMPDHLRMNIRVVDLQGQLLACGRDTALLRQQLAGKLERTIAALPKSAWTREHVSRWDFGALPEYLEMEENGITVRAYPALVDKADHVALQVFASVERAQQCHHSGLRRLFMLQIPQKLKYLRKNLPGIQQMCLQYARLGSCEEFTDDLLDMIMEQVFMNDTPIFDEQEFNRRLVQGESSLVSVANQVSETIGRLLQEYHHVVTRLNSMDSRICPSALADIQDQLDHLIYGGFLHTEDYGRLRQYPRYLKAITQRLDKLVDNPARDLQLSQQLEPLWARCKERMASDARQGRAEPELLEYRWMLEEMRVSQFAQNLGTPEPVSLARLCRQWEKLRSPAQERAMTKK